MTQRAGVRSPRDRNHREPGTCHDQAGPLATSQSKAEVALGEHCEEDQPAREHRLHNRQRRQGKSTYMKPPRNNRDRPAQREPAGAKQAHGAVQRVTRSHRGRQNLSVPAATKIMSSLVWKKR